MFFIYNINTLCFRTIDNEKRKNIYFYLLEELQLIRELLNY